jgi:hypothetical protein
MHVALENVICKEIDVPVSEHTNAAPSMDRTLVTPELVSNIVTVAPTASTLTRKSATVPDFNPQEDERSVVSILSQFFNLSSPSHDDMKFLLEVRRYGISDAKQRARDFHWQCVAAISAVERMAK